MPERSILVGQTNDAMCVLRASPEARAYGIDDPYAPWFVTDGGARMFALAKRVDPTFVDYNLVRYVMSTGVLEEAGRRGAQIVVLGVGSDCRALSLPELRERAIYLIDQPHVLASRQQVLRAHGVVEPPNVTSIALDLSRELPEAALVAHGWRPDAPSLVLAEGLLFYLPEAQAMQLIDPRWIGAQGELWCDLWTRERVELLNDAVEPRLGTRLFHAIELEPLQRYPWEMLEVTPLEQVLAQMGRDRPDVAPGGWLLLNGRARPQR